MKSRFSRHSITRESTSRPPNKDLAKSESNHSYTVNESPSKSRRPRSPHYSDHQGRASSDGSHHVPTPKVTNIEEVIGSGDVIGSSQRSDHSMGDDMQPAWEAFTALAVRGVVDVHGLVAFANDMSIECDMRLVKKALRQENINWSRGVSFEDAMKVIDTIPLLITDDVSGSEASEQGNVRYINPLEFLQRKLRSDAEKAKKADKHGKDESDTEDVEYRVKLCSVSPRTRLLLATALIFFLVAAAIVVLMALLWMRTSFLRIEQRMLSLTTTLSYLSESAVDIAVSSISQRIDSQVTFYTSYIANEWARLQNSTVSRLNNTASEMATILTIMGTGILTQRGLSLDARMSLFVDLMMSPNYRPEIGKTIHTQLQKWALYEGKEFVIINGTDGSWIDGTVSAAKFQAASCYAPMQAGQRIGSIVNSAVDLEGVSGSHTSFCVTPVMNLCITVGLRANVRLIRGRMTELLDLSNLRSNEKFIQASLNKSTHGTAAAPAEMLAWYPDDSEVDGVVRQRNPSNTSLEFCLMSSNLARCSEFASAVRACWASQCDVTNLFIPYVDGSAVYASMVYIARAKSVLTTAVRYETLKELHLAVTVRVIDGVNAVRVLPVELMLAIMSVTDHIVPNVASYVTSCPYGNECVRLDFAEEKLRLAHVNPGVTYSGEYENYALTPVIGSTSSIDGDIDIAVTYELDSQYVRKNRVANLAAKYNRINKLWPDKLEAMLYKRRDMPTSPSFDPTVPCPEDVLCTVSSVYGVLARADCPNCVRHVIPPLTNRSPVVYVTDLKQHPAGYIANQEEQPNLNSEIVGNVVDMTDSNAYVAISGPNYAGHASRACSSPFAFFHGFLTVVEEDSASLQTITNTVVIVAVASCGVVLIGIILLVWLSHRTLQKVENEWLSFKEGIDEEKIKFKGMIREIVPTKTFDRYSHGQKVVAETHQMLSFAFIDVSSFAEKQKGLPPRELVRTLAYHATLYNTVGAKHRLFRLRSFGDTAIYIGGLNGDEPPSVTAFSTACFASTVIQLLSPIFSHHPQRLPLLMEAFKAEERAESATFPVLPVRIGLHCGSAVSSLIDYGKTPNYDIHGASLSLARRMQATAMVGHVNCSTAFKELLEAGDLSGQFEFDQIRKLVVKGQGTVSTFPLKSMSVRVDENLLKSLYIDYAITMFDFRPLSSQVKSTEVSNTKSQSQSSASHLTSDSAASSTKGSSTLGEQILKASTNPPY